MVLIISNEYELSTDSVIDWLVHYQIPFVRINEKTQVDVYNISVDPQGQTDDIELVLNDHFQQNRHLKLSDVQSVWYRRGGINISTHRGPVKLFNEDALQILHQYLFEEKKELEYVIYQLLKKKKHLNTYYDDEINKIEALKVAKRCGLDVPDTLVTSSREAYQHFRKKHSELITKALRGRVYGIGQSDFGSRN